jgi:hypothetical protein
MLMQPLLIEPSLIVPAVGFELVVTTKFDKRLRAIMPQTLQQAEEFCSSHDMLCRHL